MPKFDLEFDGFSHGFYLRDELRDVRRAIHMTDVLHQWEKQKKFRIKSLQDEVHEMKLHYADLKARADKEIEKEEEEARQRHERNLAFGRDLKQQFLEQQQIREQTLSEMRKKDKEDLDDHIRQLNEQKKLDMEKHLEQQRIQKQEFIDHMAVHEANRLSEEARDQKEEEDMRNFAEEKFQRERMFREKQDEARKTAQSYREEAAKRILPMQEEDSAIKKEALARIAKIDDLPFVREDQSHIDESKVKVDRRNTEALTNHIKRVEKGRLHRQDLLLQIFQNEVAKERALEAHRERSMRTSKILRDHDLLFSSYARSLISSSKMPNKYLHPLRMIELKPFRVRPLIPGVK